MHKDHWSRGARRKMKSWSWSRSFDVWAPSEMANASSAATLLLKLVMHEFEAGGMYGDAADTLFAGI